MTNLTTVIAEVVLPSDVGPCQSQHLLENDKWSNARIAQPSHPLVTQEPPQEADHLLLPPGQGISVHGRLLLRHLLQPRGGLTWAQKRQQRLWRLNTVWWCHLRLIRTRKTKTQNVLLVFRLLLNTFDVDFLVPRIREAKFPRQLVHQTFWMLLLGHGDHFVNHSWVRCHWNLFLSL